MNRGVTRPPEPAVLPHLETADPAELHDATSSGVDLREAALGDLTGAHVDASDLCRSSAAGASWHRVSFSDCRLDGTDLANLTWRGGGTMRCSLTGGRLTGAGLIRVRLRVTSLESSQASLTSWHATTLSRSVVRGCDLREASFTETVFENVLLEDCDLRGADLSGLTCRDVELRECRLDGVRGVRGLRGARLSRDDAWGIVSLLAAELGIDVD